MKKILLIICFLGCISVVAGSQSFWVIVDNWLTNNVVADFNKDGIVNLEDFALIQSYGPDEYGLDSYGN